MNKVGRDNGEVWGGQIKMATKYNTKQANKQNKCLNCRFVQINQRQTSGSTVWQID